MKVSTGTPQGRFVELYNSDIFEEHEEVIVFTRDEFNRTFSSMTEQIGHTNKIYMYFNCGEEWQLLGYWPKIMDRIHILDLNIDQIFKNKPLQCYLDTYLFNSVSIKENDTVTSKTGITSPNEATD